MQKLIKWIYRAILVLIALIALGITGFYFWPVDEYQPPGSVLVAISPPGLSAKVGWYRFEDGVDRLVSYGERSGITLNRFDAIRDSLEQRYFEQTATGEFAQVNRPDSSRHLLRFESGGTTALPELTWTKLDGSQLKGSPGSRPSYGVREVEYYSGDLRIAGLLLEPAGDSSGVAVVFIHGSGAGHRNIFWYLSQADYLAKRGITVLLPDKRGCGKSEGTYHDADFADFASDAMAAVRFLANQTADASRMIGLVGISQGGWILPMAARKDARVRFVISVSGSLRPPQQQLKYEIANDIRDSGAPAFIADLLTPVIASRARKAKPVWWEKNGSYDPINDWSELALPRLFLLAEADKNVDVAATRQIFQNSSMRAASSAEMIVFKNTGHAMMSAESGWIRQDFLSTMAEWILSRKPPQ